MTQLQSLGKGHSLYTVHCHSEWIFWQEENSDSVMMREAGSNDLGHKQEDKRAGDHVDAGAVVVLCGHQGLCCFLHLRCKVWDYLYIPNHFRFISLSPSPRQHQCTLLIVLPLREQRQESNYFLEIKNQLGRNLIITGVSLLQKWVKIRKTSISYPPLFISTSEIAPSELEASQV